MTEDLTAPVWAVLAVGVLALVVVLVILVSARSARRRTDAALAAAREDAEALQAQVAAIEQRLSERPAAPTQVEAREYVITRLGDWGDDDVDISGDETVRVPAVPVVPAPLFADLVLREGVVQAASLAAGLRRALAPETRHRIRFEMRREVKRARKQRRADVRQARRDVEARQRTKVSA